VVGQFDAERDAEEEAGGRAGPHARGRDGVCEEGAKYELTRANQ